MSKNQLGFVNYRRQRPQVSLRFQSLRNPSAPRSHFDIWVEEKLSPRLNKESAIKLSFRSILC